MMEFHFEEDVYICMLDLEEEVPRHMHVYMQLQFSQVINYDQAS